MRSFAITMAFAFSAYTLVSAQPVQAELISPKNPAAIVSVVESQGLPAKLVAREGKSPYIESNSGDTKFLIFLLNCDDAGANCKTIQYYMGFSDAKDTTLDRLNDWNKQARFGRAYRDDEGDPVLEMDVDLDFDGLPRQNVGESLKTWTALMSSYREFLFNADK